MCERRNGTASAQWAPRLPGQPASRLHLQALVRAAFDHFDPDRRGLWVRHADTHAQANSNRPRAHPGRMSALAAAAAAQSCALEPKFRSRRAEVSARNRGDRPLFRCKTPVLDRSFGRKPGDSPPSAPNFHHKVRRGGVETTVARAARRPKVRGESPAAATELSDRKLGTGHYCDPAHFMCPSFLLKKPVTLLSHAHVCQVFGGVCRSKRACARAETR